MLWRMTTRTRCRRRRCGCCGGPRGIMNPWNTGRELWARHTHIGERPAAPGACVALWSRDVSSVVRTQLPNKAGADLPNMVSRYLPN